MFFLDVLPILSRAMLAKVITHLWNTIAKSRVDFVGKIDWFCFFLMFIPKAIFTVRWLLITIRPDARVSFTWVILE